MAYQKPLISKADRIEILPALGSAVNHGNFPTWGTNSNKWEQTKQALSIRYNTNLMCSRLVSDSIASPNITSADNKWYGGVLAPNGAIYNIPYDSATILKINPNTDESIVLGSLSSDTAKWAGGVLGSNSAIYGMPYNSTTILKIDTTTDTITTFGSLDGTAKWAGGVAATNGSIYGIPYDSTTILKIDPTTDTTTTFGSLAGSGKWIGGVLAPDGMIYGIPYNHPMILKIDPTTDTVTTFGSVGQSYLKSITISHTHIDSILTNFPLCVKIDGDADIGAVCLASGNDIVFTDADFYPLDAECESFSVIDGVATGVFWVRVPSLSATADTVIYCCYGNDGATARTNTSSVWDSYHKGVWHLGDGTTLSAVDSTINTNNGTITGITAAAGKVDGCALFDGSTAHSISVPSDPDVNLPDYATIECWFKSTQTGTAHQALIARFTTQSSATPTGYQFFLLGSGNTYTTYFGYRLNNDATWYSVISTKTNLNDGNWHHCAAVRNGSIIYIYVDGALDNTATAQGVGTIGVSASALAMGRAYLNGTWQWPLAGSLDEVRISHTIRSADWIEFEYYNMSSGEITWGDHTAAAQAKWVGGVLAPNGVIYGIPHNDTAVLKIDPITDTTTTFVMQPVYRKTITISKTNVSSDLASFPLYVKITNDTDIGAHCLTSGNDIYFTDENFNRLSAECEVFSITSGAANGTFWVKVPNISSSTNTTIYCYYGNRLAVSRTDSTGAWDSNFKGVYHFGNGTELSVLDSTANATNGVNVGATAATGYLNGAAYVNGSQWITIDSSNINFTTSLTVSCWFRRVGWAGIWASIFCKPYYLSSWANPYQHYRVARYNNTDSIGFTTNTMTDVTVVNAGTISNDTWYHLAITLTSGALGSIYLNGVLKDTGTISVPIGCSGTTPLYVGHSGVGDNNFIGWIDEFRVSSSARSTDWIKFEYYNQSSVTNELTWGAHTILEKSSKWAGGVVGSDGMIYGIPSNSSTILRINPATDAITTWGENGLTSTKWVGGTLTSKGTIYCSPYCSNEILKINNPTLDVPTDFCLSRFFNKL